MAFLQNICDEVETFCNISSTTVEQHVDMRVSRTIRDDEDAGKLAQWFSQHYPFPTNDRIMCISTGVVGGEEGVIATWRKTLGFLVSTT